MDDFYELRCTTYLIKTVNELSADIVAVLLEQSRVEELEAAILYTVIYGLVITCMTVSEPCEVIKSVNAR